MPHSLCFSLCFFLERLSCPALFFASLHSFSACSRNEPSGTALRERTVITGDGRLYFTVEAGSTSDMVDCSSLYPQGPVRAVQFQPRPRRAHSAALTSES